MLNTSSSYTRNQYGSPVQRSSSRSPGLVSPSYRKRGAVSTYTIAEPQALRFSNNQITASKTSNNIGYQSPERNRPIQPYQQKHQYQQKYQQYSNSNNAHNSHHNNKDHYQYQFHNHLTSSAYVPPSSSNTLRDKNSSSHLQLSSHNLQQQQPSSRIKKHPSQRMFLSIKELRQNDQQQHNSLSKTRKEIVPRESFGNDFADQQPQQNFTFRANKQAPQKPSSQQPSFTSSYQQLPVEKRFISPRFQPKANQNLSSRMSASRMSQRKKSLEAAETFDKLKQKIEKHSGVLAEFKRLKLQREQKGQKGQTYQAYQKQKSHNQYKQQNFRAPNISDTKTADKHRRSHNKENSALSSQKSIRATVTAGQKKQQQHEQVALSYHQQQQLKFKNQKHSQRNLGMGSGLNSKKQLTPTTKTSQLLPSKSQTQLYSPKNQNQQSSSTYTRKAFANTYNFLLKPNQTSTLSSKSPLKGKEEQTSRSPIKSQAKAKNPSIINSSNNISSSINISNTSRQEKELSSSQYLKPIPPTPTIGSSSMIKQFTPISNPWLSRSRTSYEVNLSCFKVLKKVGEGAFGEVLQAVDLRSGAFVCLKKISKEKIRTHNIINQLTQEIRIHSSLQHHNIVNLYGYFHDQTHIYLILQYLQGETLFSYLKKSSSPSSSLSTTSGSGSGSGSNCSLGNSSHNIPSNSSKLRSSIYPVNHKKFLPQIEVREKIHEIALSIRYLHDLNIIHRDIKPQNIILSNGVCKLCDFGWSAYGDIRRNTTCGTLDYSAPEIINGVSYDFGVDVWCLGVLTFELLSGKTPFYDMSRKKTMQNIVNVSKQEMQNTMAILGDEVSKQAKQFIQFILNPDAEQRPTITEVLMHSFLDESKFAILRLD